MDDMLHLDGLDVGRENVGALMETLSIEVHYRKVDTSWRNQVHRIYP